AGTLFLIMEFIEGSNLHLLVKKKGPLPVWKARDCARQAALGLQFAHERGFVHRDVKPKNLMLADRSGVVKLLDFGLAPLHAGDAPESDGSPGGEPLGTTHFLAPEVAAARPPDIRADVYSLGCTLFYLLTGRPPFDAATTEQVLGAHRQS